MLAAPQHKEASDQQRAEAKYAEGRGLGNDAGGQMARVGHDIESVAFFRAIRGTGPIQKWPETLASGMPKN